MEKVVTYPLLEILLRSDNRQDSQNKEQQGRNGGPRCKSLMKAETSRLCAIV